MRQILVDAFDALPRGEQSRIARELGVTPQRINKWKLGHNAPGPDVDLRKLEALLHLDEGVLGYVAGSTPLGDYSPAEVMRVLNQLGERLDAVEQQLGLRPPAPPAPSDRPAP